MNRFNSSLPRDLVDFNTRGLGRRLWGSDLMVLPSVAVPPAGGRAFIITDPLLQEGLDKRSCRWITRSIAWVGFMATIPKQWSNNIKDNYYDHQWNYFFFSI